MVGLATRLEINPTSDDYEQFIEVMNIVLQSLEISHDLINQKDLLTVEGILDSVKRKVEKLILDLDYEV